VGGFELSLLGPVRARVDGEPLVLGGRRQRAVLARLALAGGDPVDVDRLIDDLWAGSPPASATGTLQSYVSNLRRILGDTGATIERVGDAYRLVVPEGASASAAFEADVAEASRATAAGDPAAAVTALDRALERWHGPALADYAEEPWARTPAVRLDQLRAGAAEARDAAQHQLGGARPAPEAGDDRAPAGVVPLPPAVRERRSRSGFVGRDPQVATVLDAWEAVRAGERRIVSVAGEAGVGKTRLAQEAAVAVHRSGGHVLWGRCAAESLIAFQPVVEALRVALRSIDPEFTRSLVETRPALGALAPDLVGEAAAARAERFELYEALADLLGEVTVAYPVLLVIDDLQWADPSTVTLIDQVLRHPRAGRILLLCTVRRPAGRPTVEVDRVLADARRDGLLTTLELGGLGRDEVATLLAERGVEADDRTVAALAERTGGNPFFIESLTEHGALAGGEGRDLPESVREVLDGRLAALGEQAATVLAAAAVIGMRVDLTVLAAVTGLDQGDLLDVVDEAVAADVLAEDEDIGWVAFPHALVRQALLARLSRNREARLHLHVAEAVEALPHGPDHAATVAHHLLAGGRACPPERAVAAALAAGQRALDRVADEEAVIWARRALEAERAAEAAGRPLPSARDDALLLEARATRLLGDLDGARRLVDRVVADARSRGDAVALARAAQEAAMLSGAVGMSFSGLDPDLIALIDEALVLVGPEHPAERAALLAWSSLALNGGDDRDGQDRLSILSLEAASELPDDDPGQALSLFARRMAVGGPPGLDERLTLLGPLRRAARGWSELETVTRVLTLNDLLEAGRVKEAEAELADLRAFVAPFHRPALDTYVAFFESVLALLHGDVDRAAERSDHALTIGTPAHGGNAATAWAGQAFLIARERGELAGLVGPLADLVEAEPLVPVWRIGLAMALLAAGDPDRARAEAHAYLRDGRVTVERRSVLRYIVDALAAEVAWLLDDVPLAEALAIDLAPISHRVGVAGLGAACIGHLTRYHGLVLAVLGDLDAAEALLEEAARLAREARFGPELARALVERAIVLRRRDAPGDADLAATLDAEGRALAADLAIALTEPPA
jgi:hypothetical protein